MTKLAGNVVPVCPSVLTGREIVEDWSNLARIPNPLDHPIAARHRDAKLGSKLIMKSKPVGFQVAAFCIVKFATKYGQGAPAISGMGGTVNQIEHL